MLQLLPPTPNAQCSSCPPSMSAAEYAGSSSTKKTTISTNSNKDQMAQDYFFNHHKSRITKTKKNGQYCYKNFSQ